MAKTKSWISGGMVVLFCLFTLPALSSEAGEKAAIGKKFGVGLGRNTNCARWNAKAAARSSTAPPSVASGATWVLRPIPHRSTVSSV